LRDPETGQPFELFPGQAEFIRHAYTLTPEGRLPYADAIYSAPKKNGKSTTGAMLALYSAVVVGGPYAEVYCLANDYEQSQGGKIGQYSGMWRRACKRAGLEGKLLHDCRRTAVRNLERAGVPRSAAMAITGHKTESVYRRYAIVDAASMHEAAVKLAALHANENRGYGMTPGQIDRLAKAAKKKFSPSLALV
jgi:hypothetical protein